MLVPFNAAHLLELRLPSCPTLVLTPKQGSLCTLWRPASSHSCALCENASPSTTSPRLYPELSTHLDASKF